jgi:uncharacterized protein (TIGR03435 family)
MGNHCGGVWNGKRKCFSAMAVAVVLALMLTAGIVAAPLGAQSAASQTPAAQAPASQAPVTQSSPTQGPGTPAAPPQWQTDAGGKMEFDVVSVKQDTAPMNQQTVNSNIPLGPQDMFSPTGGLLSSTNWPLFQYMIFAYKLTPNQVQSVLSQLPKWATSDRYDIQARAPGNPTKDQYRLMMQALLADRFKLAIHYETKDVSAYALMLDKPGKFGPGFQQHPADSPCSTATPTGQGPVGTVAGGFPEICGAFVGVQASNPGRIRVGARNIPMAMIATTFSSPGLGVDRPVVDKTGLTGTFDIVFEFTPQINGPLPPNSTFQPDESGPTFLQAIKEQLGLRLDKQTASVDSIVIDHIEQPSEN